MKNPSSYLFIALVSIIMISSCGEPQKEKTKNIVVDSKSSSSQEQPPGKSVSVDVRSNQQEAVTTTGDAPIAEPPGKYDFSRNPLICSIILFDDIPRGKHTKLNKGKAKAMAEQGKMFVVKSAEGAIFFVLNEDGTFASKRLAGYCNNKKIGIIGKTYQIDEINIIVAQLMESMD